MATARKGKVEAIGREPARGAVDPRGRPRAIWHAIVAARDGGVTAPHVLHHIGLLAGAGLIAGAGGTVAFGLLGFILSIHFF